MSDPKDYLQAVREPGQRVNPLFAFLGIEVEEISPERTVLRLPLRPEFMQGAGAVAGGLIATLLDETMAHAVFSCLEPGQGTATVEMSTRFFNPAPLPGPGTPPLRCEAQVVRRGRRIAFAEAEIRDHKGGIVARCSACFVIR